MVIANSFELPNSPTFIQNRDLIKSLIADKNYEAIIEIARTISPGLASDRKALVSMLVTIGQMSEREQNQRQQILDLILHADMQLESEPTDIDMDTAALQLFPVPMPQPEAITPHNPLATLTKQPPADKSLMVHIMGSFEVYVNHQPVTDWSNRKGKLLFKYLILNREKRVPKEVLMDTFWPDSDPDAARNNLNVTMYALRRALHEHDPDFSHILFEDDCYFFNPDLLVWVDSEKFLEYAQKGQEFEKAGQILEAVETYRAASTLYKGSFLAEVTYEEWLTLPRQHLQNTYLHVLDRLSHYYFEHKDYAACINACNAIIAVDSCREDAHRRLMRCYERQGQPYLALRQYQLCKDFLMRELEVEPGTETTELYEHIRNRRA